MNWIIYSIIVSVIGIIVFIYQNNQRPKWQFGQAERTGPNEMLANGNSEAKPMETIRSPWSKHLLWSFAIALVITGIFMWSFGWQLLESYNPYGPNPDPNQKWYMLLIFIGTTAGMLFVLRKWFSKKQQTISDFKKSTTPVQKKREVFLVDIFKIRTKRKGGRKIRNRFLIKFRKNEKYGKSSRLRPFTKWYQIKQFFHGARSRRTALLVSSGILMLITLAVSLFWAQPSVRQHIFFPFAVTGIYFVSLFISAWRIPTLQNEANNQNKKLIPFIPTYSEFFRKKKLSSILLGVVLCFYFLAWIGGHLN